MTEQYLREQTAKSTGHLTDTYTNTDLIKARQDIQPIYGMHTNKLELK